MRYFDFEMTALIGIVAAIGVGVILAAEAGLASAPDEGIRIRNGDIGMMLWGPHNRPTFSIGKADVWDRRFYGHKEPVITLADLKEYAKTGDFPDPGYQTYCAYDFPGPKPVGQLIIGLPGTEDQWAAEMKQEGPGVLMLTATRLGTRGEQRLDLRIYVHAARNLIVIEGDTHKGLEGLWFRLYRHQDTCVLGKVDPTLGTRVSEAYDYSQDEGHGPIDPPTSGHEKDLGWVTQVFPAELTFPQGFRYTFAALTSVEGMRVESVQGQRGLGTPAFTDREWEEGETWHRGDWRVLTHYRPINNASGAAATFHLPRIDGRFQILATVVTTTETSDTLALARSRLQAALPESPAERLAAHQAATKNPRYPFLTRKPGGYYGDIPLCGAMGDASEFCCQDTTGWHGDFHFDEQQYGRSYFISNRIEQLEPYFQLVEKLVPLGQKNARQVYDCPGTMFAIVHYPIRTDGVVHTTVVWEQIMEITALTMKPLWEHYLYTGNEEFLRSRGYPVLREGARFYAAYVTPEEDGYYHVVPTCSPEHWGLTKDFERNKDSQSALSLIKYHLHAAAQAAEVLGEDKEEREIWAHIAAHMAPYPTYETPDGPIFADVLGAPPITYNIPVPLTAIWWGDQITPESPPDVLAIARRTIEKIDARQRQGNVDLCSCLLGDYPGRVMGVEGLLQSRGGWDMVKKRGGWIRVFPAVPDNYTGSFSNYLAIGAFEVSAACKEGTVAELTIRSRVGNTCQLINPWPGQTLVVKEAESGETARLAGGHIRFPTRAGHTYLIEPATA